MLAKATCRFRGNHAQNIAPISPLTSSSLKQSSSALLVADDLVSSAIFKFYLKEFSSMSFLVLLMCISVTDFCLLCPDTVQAVMTTGLFTAKPAGVGAVIHI